MEASQKARFGELRHHATKLSGGGLVVLLDTGAVITPEAEAMLQALYSRSPASVYGHLEQIAEKGPDNFMSSFYVGYGHKSIGDCGTITLFIEGISMLAAKAVQDWMLYAGQEVSTRYVDFSTQRFENPVPFGVAKNLLDTLRNFYVEALPKVAESLTVRYPKSDEEKETVYLKAINARVFDILRGFLPAGATTSVAWHTNLRQAADKLALLRHHPLKEVQNIADALQIVLMQGYPSSFGHKRYNETETYNHEWMGNYYYLTDKNCPNFSLYRDDIAYDEIIGNQEIYAILKNRPAKTELPKFLGELGTMQFRFLLDFGSFRDIQRQRAVNQRMPLLTTGHGFDDWYLNELPKEIYSQAIIMLENCEFLIRDFTEGTFGTQISKEEAQYYIPMGYRVPQRITGDIPALVYLAELRATQFVHPTLQVRAHQIADALMSSLGQYGLNLFVDKNDVGRFDVRRGLQDIVQKS